MSKRVKINFETINKGKYEIIPPKLIHETNERIRENMKKIIREYKIKDKISRYGRRG